MATKEKKHTVRGISPSGRVGFPRLFKPEAMEEGGKEKYQITLSFVPDELDEKGTAALQSMADAATECSKAQFGVDYKDDDSIRSPFRKGTESKYHEDNEIFVRFSSMDKPEVVDGLREPITEESNQVYPGMLARVSWSCQAYDRLGNKGVTFYLNNVQKTGKGERIAGGPSAVDEFDAIEPEGGENGVAF
jgi:hypothetical protein